MQGRFASCVLLLVLSSCKPREHSQYLDDLSALIQRSDRIIVTEHSSGFDALVPPNFDDPDSTTVRSLIPEEIVYERRELSPTQKQMFLDTIESLDPAPQTAVTACVPVVHHTIRFFKAQQLISTMEICFQCGQFSWDGTKAVEPEALYSGLHTVVSRIGLHPERDWEALAKSHLAAR